MMYFSAVVPNFHWEFIAPCLDVTLVDTERARGKGLSRPNL